MLTHSEAPAAECAPRVPVATSSERGSASRSMSALLSTRCGSQTRAPHACRWFDLGVRSFVNARTITFFRNHHSDVCRAVCSASSRAFPRLLSGIRGGVRARHLGTARRRNATEAAAVGRSLGGIASRRTEKRLGFAANGSSSATDCAAPIRFS